MDQARTDEELIARGVGPQGGDEGKVLELVEAHRHRGQQQAIRANPPSDETTRRCSELRAARSISQMSTAATTARAATTTEYHGLALAISWVMGLPRPSVHGLALVQSTPLHIPLVLRAPEVEPAEQLQQQEQGVAPDEQPDGQALFDIAVLGTLVLALNV